jgi:hypothetical protein
MAFCASAGLKYSIYAKPANNERNHLSGSLVNGTLNYKHKIFQHVEVLHNKEMESKLVSGNIKNDQFSNGLLAQNCRSKDFKANLDRSSLSSQVSVMK